MDSACTSYNSSPALNFPGGFALRFVYLSNAGAAQLTSPMGIYTPRTLAHNLLLHLRCIALPLPQATSLQTQLILTLTRHIHCWPHIQPSHLSCHHPRRLVPFLGIVLQALFPWWQSLYVSHGNQNVQQFVNSPALYAFPHPVPESHVFHVRFIEGNVSTCYGCRNRYSKKPQPPDDICLQTEE